MTIIGEIVAWILAIVAIYTVISVLYIAIYGIIKKESWADGLKGCLVFWFLLFAIPICITALINTFKSEEKEGNKIKLEQEYRHKSIEVYICTGRYAKKYHSRPNCRGLNNCRGGIKKVELEKIKGRRSPCSICY